MNDRKQKILELLLSSKEPLTTTQISQKLNVTSRTIRSDLAQIESAVSTHGCRLMKKPHVGIWIEGSMADKNTLFLSFNTEPLPTESYSKEYRVGSILAQILLCESFHD